MVCGWWMCLQLRWVCLQGVRVVGVFTAVVGVLAGCAGVFTAEVGVFAGCAGAGLDAEARGPACQVRTLLGGRGLAVSTSAPLLGSTVRGWGTLRVGMCREKGVEGGWVGGWVWFSMACVFVFGSVCVACCVLLRACGSVMCLRVHKCVCV